MTFIGKPRDHHVYEHAHESPKVMYVPLVILAVFAFGIGWPMWGLTNLLEQARPAGTVETVNGAVLWPSVVHPAEHMSHEGDDSRARFAHGVLHGAGRISCWPRPFTPGDW